MTIREDIQSIIVKQLGAEPSAIVDQASFIDDLGADSLSLVELVLAFEEHFKIDIPDSVSSQIHTVGDAVSLIERAQNKNSGASQARASAI